MVLTPSQHEILASLEAAYADDPHPESGRTYFSNEEEYDVARALQDEGLVFEVTGGVRANVRWAHFGITDEGIEALR